MLGVLLLTLSVTTPVELVDVATLDSRFVFDIRYATADNFVGKAVYTEARCLVRPEVGKMLLTAQKVLDAQPGGRRLMFKDCYRPHTAQHALWDAVKGTPKARYVANPHTRTGSIHSYGAAVDLTLAEADGTEVDMGTAYDHLGKLAEPRHEKRYLAAGKLTKKQVKNRRQLRKAMRKAGFLIIRNEWWHFNAAPAKKVRKSYPRLDVPFSSVSTKAVP